MTELGRRGGRLVTDEPQYAIETQRFGRRWAWAISLPERSGRPSPMRSSGTHPFSDRSTRMIGQWNLRVRRGWAWSESGAIRKAERAIDRHKRDRAGMAASQRTYAIKEHL